MAILSLVTTPHARIAFPTSAAAWVALFLLVAEALPASQGQTTTFTMYSASAANSRRSVVVRTGSTPNMIALDQLAGTFGLTFTEDRAANGVIIGTRGERIFAFPGQAFVRTAGRVVALDGAVQRDRNTWLVPIDFLNKALGPAIGEPIVVRRSSRLVLVGSVRVPEITGKVERTSAGARVVIAVQPATPHSVTRDGNRVTIRFEAAALDAAPISGFIPEFAPAARVDGSSLVIDLGPSAVAHRVEEDRVSNTVTIELFPAAPVVTPRPAPPVPGQMPFDQQSGSLRTIVIDAGHGGEDVGAVSAAGTQEKDLTLQIARRLKATIEARLGLRVLLTRDADDTVPVDRRTELANNNKADVFLSLHANWSVRAASRGTQVYTVGLDAYRDVVAQADARRRTVPIVGGGSRVIDPVPWDLAQVPFADQSATLAAVLARQFAEKSVPLHARPATQAPMRILMGAHMPAVLIELGFLSNADDERALTGVEWQTLMVDSVIAALTELRRGIPAAAPATETERR